MDLEHNYQTESSGVETSPELNSSFENRFSSATNGKASKHFVHHRMPARCTMDQLVCTMESPEEKTKIQPRKLRFNYDDLDGSDSEQNDSKNNNMLSTEDFSKQKPIHKSPLVTISPPYRKVRALKLFDSPATPKTIVQKSVSLGNQISLTANSLLVPSQKHNFRPLLNKHNILFSPLSPANKSSTCDKTKNKYRAISSHLNSDYINANVNPFTPPTLMMRSKKRTRQEELSNNNILLDHCDSSKSFFRSTAVPSKYNQSLVLSLTDVDFDEVQQAPKRFAMQDTNISRYDKEFVEIELIGSGEFGLVYQCLNRLDGCVYAIKKSIKPVAGSTFE